MFLENVLNYQESVADIILFIYFGRTGSLLPCRLSPFAFPGGSVGKESACNAGDPGSIPGSGRSPGEGKGSPLQYSGLENSVDCVVYGVALGAQLVENPPAVRETWAPSLGWEDPLEKGKAPHSSILAWRIPWTVQSMGSQRVRHD